MAGNVKVGGNVIATHTGAEGAGTVTLSNVTASALKMSSSGNTITDSAGNAVLSESSRIVTIDNVNQTYGNKKYFIQGKLAADFGPSGGVTFNVGGTTNPYFIWQDTLTNAGFDIGPSSSGFDRDFKFTKKGIYYVGFSATFRHVTTNTSKHLFAAIRGSGSTQESTNNLAAGYDQLADVNSSADDYANIYVSLVKEFAINDVINFHTDAGGPATDAVRSHETHVSVYLIRAT